MGNVYLYGMIVLTNSFLLQNEYPVADTYGEIKQSFILPGGETGTCATVLNSLGCNIKIDGPHMGYNTYPRIKEFYQDKSVDISSLTFDENYCGLQDYVLIDKTTRTPFGTFGSYFTDDIKRWNMPNENDIIDSTVVGLDPFFQEASVEVARLCQKHNKPFVVIDCPYDSEINKLSSINIVSSECMSQYYKDENRVELFEKYMDSSDNLVIFTFGSKPIMYGRKETGVKYLDPFKVNVISTLGAGDSFKAGCVYALLHKMSDEDTVRFASATAAVACMNFPLPLNPPTLENISKLIYK